MNPVRCGNDEVVPRTTSRTSPRASSRLDLPPAAPTTRLGDMPPATRATTSGWRDPRLWIGVVLVTGSVVAGARILSGADDMTSVWAASSDLAAGQTLTADDLEPARVRFDESADHDRYLAVDDELPTTLTLTRPLSSGELVPAAALGEEAAADTVSLSIAVAPEHVPTDLVRGSRVDVWVVADRTVAQRRGRAAAELVLAVPESDEEQLGEVLAAVGDDRVRVVGRG